MQLPAEANLSAGQLANQVVLRAREVIAGYYDGWLRSDDELAPHTTRDISLRTQVRRTQPSLAEHCSTLLALPCRGLCHVHAGHQSYPLRCRYRMWHFLNAASDTFCLDLCK